MKWKLRVSVAIIAAGALAIPAIALASGYKAGTYTQGVSVTRGTALSLKITKGSFTVQGAGMDEKCTNGQTAHLEILPTSKFGGGSINSKGHFSATKAFAGGKTTITGTVSGSSATATVKDKGPSTSQPGVTCQGRHTFHLKRGGSVHTGR